MEKFTAAEWGALSLQLKSAFRQHPELLTFDLARQLADILAGTASVTEMFATMRELEKRIAAAPVMKKKRKKPIPETT